jgi:hypothetical protein
VCKSSITLLETLIIRREYAKTSYTCASLQARNVSDPSVRVDNYRSLENAHPNHTMFYVLLELVRHHSHLIYDTRCIMHWCARGAATCHPKCSARDTRPSSSKHLLGNFVAGCCRHAGHLHPSFERAIGKDQGYTCSWRPLSIKIAAKC